MLVKGTITVRNMTGAVGVTINANKKIILKTCAPFTDCITELDNTQADNAKTIDTVISR